MVYNYTDLLLEAGSLLGKAKTDNDVFEILIEYANNALKPDLSCLYIKDTTDTKMKLKLKRGFPNVPDFLQRQTELSNFLSESKKLVCLNSRKQSPFKDLLLTENMSSGMAISIFNEDNEYGTLFVNSQQPYYFKEKEILYLENLTSIIPCNPAWSCAPLTARPCNPAWSCAPLTARPCNPGSFK